MDKETLLHAARLRAAEPTVWDTVIFLTGGTVSDRFALGDDGRWALDDKWLSDNTNTWLMHDGDYVPGDMSTDHRYRGDSLPRTDFRKSVLFHHSQWLTHQFPLGAIEAPVFEKKPTYWVLDAIPFWTTDGWVTFHMRVQLGQNLTGLSGKILGRTTPHGWHLPVFQGKVQAHADQFSRLLFSAWDSDDEQEWAIFADFVQEEVTGFWVTKGNRS